jgi:hypothetical protein
MVSTAMAAATCVLAQAAELLGHDQAEKAALGQKLEVLAREQQLLVALHGIGAHFALAQGDERVLQGLLLVAQNPLRIPLVAQAPEFLVTPFLHHELPCWCVNFSPCKPGLCGLRIPI